MINHNISWAAGFLEGEGFIYSKKHGGTIMYAANQVERWPLDRLVESFGGRLSIRKSQNIRWHDQWHWEVTGPRAVGLAFTLFSLLSPKRRLQIKKAITNWKLHKAHASVRNSCINGHPYLPETTKIVKMYGTPSRRCLICLRKQQRAWRERHAA